MKASVMKLCVRGAVLWYVIFGITLNWHPRLGSATESPSKDITMEGWMQSWMTTSKPPVGALHVSRFVEPVYFLTKKIAWKPEKHQKVYKPVEAPVGFVTDFASVPRVFWSLVRPDGEYSYAAILHDYLYWIQDRPREEADLLFKVIMEEFSIAPATVEIVYRAVRVGGQGAWDVPNGKLPGNDGC